jgi:hypothetical protein
LYAPISRLIAFISASMPENSAMPSEATPNATAVLVGRVIARFFLHPTRSS